MRIQDGAIVEARIHLDDVARAGEELQAVLKSAGFPAIASNGTREFLLPKGAPGKTEGAAITIEVTREAIPGPEPWKRPLARLAEGRAIPVTEGEVLPFPSPEDRLVEAGWLGLLEEARSGIVRFAGGELRVSPTPAMTLIDVDGILPAFDLALTGAKAAARAILRHGIGGSIGIDLPTVTGKRQRQAIAEAVDAILPQPFERTTVNGFGFLQIVRPRRHASLFELALDRAAFEARGLLRLAAKEFGRVRLTAAPAVIAVLERNREWIGQLEKQVGGAVDLRSDPGVAISAGYAEQRR